MAIIQQQMLDLIQAGRAWQSAFDTAMQQLRFTVTSIRKGDFELLEGLGHLDVIERNNLPHPLAVACIEAEARHYASNAKRNTAAKLRARGRRHLEANNLGRELPVRHSNYGAELPQPAQDDIITEEEMGRILAGKFQPKGLNEPLIEHSAPTRQEYEKLEEFMDKTRKAQQLTPPPKAKALDKVYSEEDWQRLKTLNPGLATVNDPPEDFNVEDL